MWNDDIGEALYTENGPHMAETLKKISQYIKDMDSVIDDTLGYIRMTSGKLELLETEYETAKLIDHIRDDFANAEKDDELKVNLSVRQDESVPDVLMGDSGRIGQIVTSVTQNLVRATENANVELEISAKPTSYAVMLLFRIEDVGKQLESDEQMALFKRIRSENLHAVDMIEEGNMGISVAHMLTKKMSGKILVEEGVKGNVAITICLPQLVIKGGNR